MIRRFPNKIADIIEAKGLRLNTISKTSGISHTYLTNLVKGKINRPGKAKIASILLALNFSISEINKVLAEYDYRSLSKLDIPDILTNNQKRKIEGNTLPQYDRIYFDLLLAALEGIGGNKILVKSRPSGIFQPEQLYLQREYPFKNGSEAGTFLYDLTLALVQERRALFKKNCNAGSYFETYICLTCLDDFLDKNLNNKSYSLDDYYRELVVMYFANAISVILHKPKQHRTKIVERCPYFHFQLQNVDSDSPKLSFPGRKLHDFQNEYDQLNLEGFTSDSPAMIALFRREVDLCEKSIVPDIDQNYPRNLIDFLLKRFKRYGLKAKLQTAVDELMGKPPITLY